MTELEDKCIEILKIIYGKPKNSKTKHKHDWIPVSVDKIHIPVTHSGRIVQVLGTYITWVCKCGTVKTTEAKRVLELSDKKRAELEIKKLRSLLTAPPPKQVSYVGDIKS